MAEVLIFDFDGTLADDFDFAVDEFRKLVTKRGLKYSHAQAKRILRNRPITELIKDYHIGKASIAYFAFLARRRTKQLVPKITLIPGIREAILELRPYYTMGIMTSNAKKNIKNILTRHDLFVFDFVATRSNIFRKDKSLKRILKKLRVNSADCYYIGDEVRDILACKQAGVPCIAVSWGFNSYKLLKKQKPDAIVRSPKELVKFLNKKVKIGGKK